MALLLQSVLHFRQCLLTEDFSASGLLAALIIAVLFFWQTQHRSLIGFMTMMYGVSWRHKEVKVEYATGVISVSTVDSLYWFHTAYIIG